MYPLLALSLIAIFVIVERLLAFRSLAHLAPGLVAKTVELAKSGSADQALTSASNRVGPVAAAVATVLRYRDLEDRDIERKVEEVGQPYFSQMEKLLPVLDTTTTIAPLLGLLGTIIGMIGTFNAIAVQKNSQNQDNILSGVGEALYATATGILIAVICFVAYNYFASRIRSVISETEHAATTLLNALRGH